MKQSKIARLCRWGMPALLSLTVAACVPSDPRTSSSSQSSSVSSPASSSSNPTTSSSSSTSYQAPSNNLASNGGVESGTTGWAARGDAQISRNTSQRHSGSGSLYVQNRGDYWHGASYDIGALTPGNQYEVQAWIKLASGEPMETIKITGKLVDDAESDTYLEYTEIASATVTSGEWTQLSGSYVPDGDFEMFIFEAFDGSENVSFYVDSFSVSGEVDPNYSSSSSVSSSSSSGSNSSTPDVDPSRKGLSALTNIPLGVAVNLEGGSRDTLNSQPRKDIVANNFSQVSVENSMKMSYWNESDFSNSRVDSLASWARQNGLTIHGHTLVWHRSYQLPSWADDNNDNFRQDFVNHVKGVADQYQDLIVSWDVVNEGLYDSNDDDDNGPGGTGGAMAGGVNYRKSVFYRKLGADYFAEAFRAAREAAPNAELYYNDFNTENNQDKTTWLVNLVQGLVDDGVPIDGVGFQMHVLPDWPSISNIKSSWQKVLDIDPNLKLKITELDVRVNNQYANPPQVIQSCNNCPELQNQKQRYKDIIKAYYETVPAHRRGGITIWGIADPDSWFAQDPDWPLLWDGNLNPKPAYDGVKEALEESN